MSLTGSRTLIRRSAEQWREIQLRFEHSGQTQAAFCAAEGLALGVRTGVGSTRLGKTKRGHFNFGLTYCFTSLSTDAFRCILRYPLDRNDARAMAEHGRKSTRLTVSFDEADYAGLNAMVSMSDVSMSWVIRQAIQRFVREHGTEPVLPLTPVKQADRKEASDSLSRTLTIVRGDSW